MQLVFTVEEFRVMIHLLRDFCSDTENRIQLIRAGNQLLEKLMGRDFGLSLDELEDLEEILRRSRESLASRPGDPEELAHDRLLLERVLERVTEACAMA